MKGSTGEMNEKWARQLVKELVHQGIRYFCIAPGSRSTPLVIAAHAHPLAETFVHFDERGLSFHALGYAKATGNPAAVIVTSGTAVGNLLPAIMEAHSDRIPMIILTADRPPELRDCGANQAADQVKIFQNFIRWQYDLSCPDTHLSPSFIGSTAAAALAHSQSDPKGPVHINCMFREPFLSSTSLSSSERGVRSLQTRLAFGQKNLSENELFLLAEELSEHEKGIIVVGGGLSSHPSYEPLFALSNLLKWPIFPDILSPVRSLGKAPGAIPYFDLILKSISLNEDFTPDAILQFGDRFVSKKLLDWIGAKKPKFYGLAASHEKRVDPLHFLTHRIIAEPWNVIEGLAGKLKSRPHSSWLKYWEEINLFAKDSLFHFFEQHKDLSEPYFFHALSSWIPKESPLFLGNSLPIREANAFFCPDLPVGPIFGNRGVSGIDGNIGTAAGISRGLQKPLLAVMGDLTFLHDLNSLAQIKNSSVPITLLVINNDGGGIFSFLPIAKQTQVFEPFFATPHGLDLRHAAALFKLDYQRVETPETLEKILQEKRCDSLILELKTSREENCKSHQEILSYLKEVLNYFSQGVKNNI